MDLSCCYSGAMVQKEKTAIAFGSFDIIHPGHIHYLKGAARYGKLTVVVARDRSIRLIKGSDPVMNEQARVKIIGAIRFVDRAVLGRRVGKLNEMYKVLLRFRPDTIVLGYDQNVDMDYLKWFLGKNRLRSKIVRLPPHRDEIFKSSKLKRLIRESHVL